MTTSPLRSPLSSEQLYRALLWLYPAQFRRVYGREMAQTFRDCYREEQGRGGSRNIARLWSLVLSDLVTSVCVEHWKASITFFKSLLGLEKESLMTNTLLNLDVALRTDIGHRPSNEDNMLSYVPQDPQVMAKKGAIFVVADGLGGHVHGEVASELAVNTIRDTYYRDTNEDIVATLSLAVELANVIIWQKNDEKSQSATEDDKEKGVMGATCVAAVLQGDRVYVANVGDSLAYVIRAGQVMQIAQNHSWVAGQVREGLLTEDQARSHEKRNVITRCLGTSPTVEVYVTSESVQNGDILVLCTDGLWSLIEEDELRSIVEQYEPQESAKRLVERANENGGPDNITAVVVRVSLTA
jgi:serine/threonine protein phosphatase PrpC